ncbi:terminase [Devosia riboflavina]|uniref:Terminase n=1 Tax=Devosia riboflavina TaxID=46914 RepID=A0A087LM32_9HYPH|nr:P27 family phage terminase small subunit [Devosia riboflavina]KFL25685.1 terminase [Devosia riboflavina]KFL27040.1 terminase [Devosia sp. 17-2-E-8]
MGRRKDDPHLQAAKGFPGRRKKQVEAEIAAAVTSAEEPTLTPHELPSFFSHAPAHWKVAIALWNDLVAVLRASGRWRPGYRTALARYCALTQKWTEAMEQLRRDLPKGGVTVKVTKGDGNEVFRTHPSVEYMQKVGVELRLMEQEFGFTPRADMDMTRVETFNAAQGRLPLHGGGPRNPNEGRTPDGDEGGDDPLSLMSDADSRPPGARPN